MQIVLENMFIKGLLWFIWIINTIGFWFVNPNIINFLTMLLLVCVYIESKSYKSFKPSSVTEFVGNNNVLK